jgi:hypothetical protein
MISPRLQVPHEVPNVEKSSRGTLQEETLKFRKLQDADTAARAGAFTGSHLARALPVLLMCR